MKELCKLLLFSAIGLFQVETTLGQTTWKITSFTLQIPVLEFDSTYEYVHTFHGSSQVSHTSINFSQTSFDTGAIVQDSFFVKGAYGAYGATYVDHSVNMNFIFDLLNRQLKDFYIDMKAYFSYTSNSIHPPYTDNVSGSESSVVKFTSLPFTVVNNDTVVIKVIGKKCKDAVKTADSHSSTVDNYANGVFQSGSIDYTIQLSDDTGSYICSFTFTLSEPINKVITTTLPQNLSISSSIPNHQIDFTFPMSNHSQMLYIYDILGRESAHIDIPAGITQYNLSTLHYPSGYYFARLGNMDGHFRVY